MGEVLSPSNDPNKALTKPAHCNVELFFSHSLLIALTCCLTAIISSADSASLSKPVASRQFRAPFKTCLFILTDTLSLEAFYRIHGAPPREIADPLNVSVIERPADDGLRTLIFYCLHAGEQKTHMVVKRQLLIREDWGIEQMLSTDWADIYNLQPGGAADERRFFDDGLLFFRIILNVLLYLGSSEPDVMECLSPRGALEERAAQSAKWKKLRRKADEVSELPFTAVGSTVSSV